MDRNCVLTCEDGSRSRSPGPPGAALHAQHRGSHGLEQRLSPQLEARLQKLVTSLREVSNIPKEKPGLAVTEHLKGKTKPSTSSNNRNTRQLVPRRAPSHCPRASSDLPSVAAASFSQVIMLDSSGAVLESVCSSPFERVITTHVNSLILLTQCFAISKAGQFRNRYVLDWAVFQNHSKQRTPYIGPRERPWLCRLRQTAPRTGRNRPGAPISTGSSQSVSTFLDTTGHRTGPYWSQGLQQPYSQGAGAHELSFPLKAHRRVQPSPANRAAKMEGNVLNSSHPEDGKLRCEGNLAIITGSPLTARVARLLWGPLRHWDSSTMYSVKGVNGYTTFLVKTSR